MPLIGLIGYALALLSGTPLWPVALGLVAISGLLALSYWHKLVTSSVAGVTPEMSALITYLIGALAQPSNNVAKGIYAYAIAPDGTRGKCLTLLLGLAACARRTSALVGRDPEGWTQFRCGQRLPSCDRAATVSLIGRTGRTSTQPTRAGGIFEAIWIASFRSRASII